jgi:anti-sigma factor RsiW
MMQHLTTETIIDYMHGALSPQEDAAVHAHMESCAACRKEFEAEATLTEMLRSYAAAQERDLPATVKAEVWSRVRSAQASPWSVRNWLRPLVAVPLAAAIALAAYFGSTRLAPQPGPTIEAAYYLQDHEALNSTIPFSDRASVNPIDVDSSTAIDTTQQKAVTIEATTYTADANH